MSENIQHLSHSLIHSKPIIIEGPDGSGKSTLISRHFPHAIHMGGPPKSVDELRDRLYLPRPGNAYDRWTAVSEQVYGAVLRGQQLISQEEFDIAIRFIRPIVVYCRPSVEVLDANLEKQIEKTHKSSVFISRVTVNRVAIRSAYDHIMNVYLPRLGVPVFHYDYTKEIYPYEK